jgi:hypothetical protein
LPYIVNSSPGAGLRFEPSVTFETPQEALTWATELERRGMRMVRIRDTASGRIFEQKALKAELQQGANDE